MRTNGLEPRSILLLGGSNAGMTEGWAYHFAPRAAERGWLVENGFLGAVGSLYGVLALHKRISDGLPWPEIIVFEYMLNDLILANARTISPFLVRDCLDEVGRLCAQRGVKLFILGLEPRAGRPPSAIGPTARIRRIYSRASRLTPALGGLFIERALGRLPGPEDYIDDNHLTPRVSEQIADALVAELEPCMRVAAPVAATGAQFRAGFCYVSAGEASLEGQASRGRVNTRVFRGQTVEMSRPALSLWQGEGRLIGLLICADATSGAYRITAGPWRRRKNAASEVLDLLGKFVTLHYLADPPPRGATIAIEMSDDEAELEATATEAVPLERAARTPFDSQTLKVYGLIFWNGPRGWRALFAPFEAWARALWRARRN